MMNANNTWFGLISCVPDLQDKLKNLSGDGWQAYLKSDIDMSLIKASLESPYGNQIMIINYYLIHTWMCS